MYSICPLLRFSIMLDQLFSQGHIWQCHRGGHTPVVDTGFELLNHYLPGGGWPTDGVTEILYPNFGIGELSLLLPCLRQLSEKEHWQAWVAPPWQPNAAALAAVGIDIRTVLLITPSLNRDILWALEESLKSGAVSAVLGWPQQITPPQARRLQMCAAQYQVPCFLFKQQPLTQPSQATPCTLRLQLRPLSNHSLEIDILKQRQGWPPPPFPLTVKRYSRFRYLT
jgi:cell division inhibitor SulA